jgi:1-deoxy-D-xylulose-5-phosphate reductoisomerase
LTYPDRLAVNGDALALDVASLRRLTFCKPDLRRFPCLELARRALQEGGTAPCVLNAADEVAVGAFLEKRLRFAGIPSVIEKVLDAMSKAELDSLESVLECDQEARRRAAEFVRRAA